MRTLPFRRARPLAAALAVAALITVAGCSSSSKTATTQPSTPPSSATGGSVAGATTTQTPANQTPATDARSTGKGPNPCTIVTAAEVQAILGAAATPAGPTEENRGSVCKWHPGSGGSLLVQVFQGKEFYNPSLQASASAKSLSGIGDKAYLDDFGTTRSAVGFLKGDTAVFIDGFEITGSAAVVTAARDAAAKV